MTVKQAAARMRRSTVDRAAELHGQLTVPEDGWLRTVRRALGMTLAQVGDRVGVTRSLVSQAEKAELSSNITLKHLEKIAGAMGCKVVYAVVPEEPVRQLLMKQARKQARKRLHGTNVTMAFEDQALSADQLEEEVERVAQGLVASGSSRLWDDS